jgi:hypothetical protein
MKNANKTDRIAGTGVANKYATLAEARTAIRKLSNAHPKQYFIIANCFGWFIDNKKRLNVQDPSSQGLGASGSYWLNGKEKSFTTKQRQADEAATPWMS